MRPQLIQGARHKDPRGTLDFFNTLNLSQVVRMYRIKPADTATIRAWQGHRVEQKWFYCYRGSFVVNLVPLNKFKEGASLEDTEIYTLQADSMEVLHIPGGYVNGFRALESGSELLVFSSMDLEGSQKDDIRFSLEERPFKDQNI